MGPMAVGAAALGPPLVGRQQRRPPRLSRHHLLLLLVAPAAAQKRFWLSTTGAIAGGVFGPALAAANRAKSTIAAFSGISGSVNAMQADLNDGSLSEASAIAQRNQVSSQIMDDVKNYISAKDDNERCSRAVELLARCTAVDSTGSAPINSVPASSVASTKTP